MFGIGMPEMLLILAVALIVIGPKKLPDLARSLGKALGEFKKATSDLKDSIQFDTELKEVKTAFDDLNQTPEEPSGQEDQEAVPPSPEAKAMAVDDGPEDENPVSPTPQTSSSAGLDMPAEPAFSDSTPRKEG